LIEPTEISDYHFTKIANERRLTASARQASAVRPQAMTILPRFV